MPAIIDCPCPSISKSEFLLSTVQWGDTGSSTNLLGKKIDKSDVQPITILHTYNAHTTQHSVSVKKDTKILSYGQKYLIRCMMGMTMIWMMGINPMMPVANRLLFELEWIKSLSIHNLNAGFVEREKKFWPKEFKSIYCIHFIISDIIIIIHRTCNYQELLGWLINEGDHCCWTTGDKLKVTINILLKYQTNNI